MTDLDKLDDHDVMVAEHEVTCAVLFNAFTSVQYESRETAGASAQLDYGSDRREEAFESLRKLHAAREAARLRTLAANLLTEATTASQAAQQVSALPGAGNREWQALDQSRGVAQGVARVIEMLDKEVKEHG